MQVIKEKLKIEESLKKSIMNLLKFLNIKSKDKEIKELKEENHSLKNALEF